MRSEEDKDKEETKDEESESESEEEKEDIKKLENKKLAEIKMDEDGKLLGLNFNKENCVEAGLLDIREDIELYSNLYPIKFTKDIQVCEYPFIIKPECHEESVILKILREASPELFKTYGYYYRSGNSFFALKCIEIGQTFQVVIHHRGWIQYTIFVKDTPKVTVIEKDKIMENDNVKDKEIEKDKISENEIKDFDEFTEKMIYLVIREILSANPYVHFDRDN